MSRTSRLARATKEGAGNGAFGVRDVSTARSRIRVACARGRLHRQWRHHLRPEKTRRTGIGSGPSFDTDDRYAIVELREAARRSSPVRDRPRQRARVRAPHFAPRTRQPQPRAPAPLLLRGGVSSPAVSLDETCADRCPVFAWVFTREHRRSSRIELLEPSSVPIGIRRSIDTRDNLRCKLQSLFFRKRQSVGEDALRRASHDSL